MAELSSTPPLWTGLAQIGRGPGGVLSEIWGWMNRNPGETAIYLAVLGIFIWAVWRFGRG